MSTNKNKNKDRDFDRNLPSFDIESLSRAYTESLDKVTFGGKKLSETENAEKPSSPHDEIVEKIREKNRALSSSIWTDEPVLKPKKSVWLEDDYDVPTEEKTPAEKQEITEETTAEKGPEEVVIPFTMEKNRLDGAKREITVEVAPDGSVKKKEPKKSFTLKIPESYYREYDVARTEKPAGISGRKIEIIDKRKPLPQKDDPTVEEPETKTVTDEVKKIGEQSSADDSSDLENYEKTAAMVKKRKAEREERKKNNIHELEFSVINIAVCAAIFFVAFAALIFMQRESGFIQSENRDLSEFPEFSVSSFFSGEFTGGVTDYFTDTVPNRESLKKFCAGFTNCLGVKLNDTVISGGLKNVEKETLDQEKIAKTTTVTAFTGKPTEKTGTETKKTTAQKKTTESEKIVDVPENLDDGQWEGDVIVSGKGKDVRAVGAYYGTFENGDKYAETINKWKAELGDGVNVYNMCIPTSAAYYMPENLRDSVSDQKDNIDNIAAGLEGIINTDVFDAIGEHKDEYIYSRTDHHWQPLGAYYAAQVFAGQAGVDFPALDTYEKCEIEDFVGTMYAYSNYNSDIQNNPDTFIYYKPDNDYTVKYYDTKFENPVESGLFFDYAEGINCYSAILNVDNEIAEIETDCDNGRVLVVFKDSFGNALIPFLTHGFSKIYVCDFRYFDINAIDFCREVGCTDLLFGISITSCSTPTKTDCLNNIRIQ